MRRSPLPSAAAGAAMLALAGARAARAQTPATIPTDTRAAAERLLQAAVADRGHGDVQG